MTLPESGITNRGLNRFYRPFGRNLEQAYHSERRMVHMGMGNSTSGLSVEPFSQFGSQRYQYQEQQRQVTPRYQVSVPLVRGQMPETIIIPETEVMKHEASVTPVADDQHQQLHEAQSNKRAVIIDGKKYRLNVAL